MSLFAKFITKPRSEPFDVDSVTTAREVWTKLRDKHKLTSEQCAGVLVYEARTFPGLRTFGNAKCAVSLDRGGELVAVVRHNGAIVKPSVWCQENRK